MKFIFDGQAKLIDEKKYINVIQFINPYTSEFINTFEDAERWMRQFLLNELNSQPLYFELYISESNEDIEVEKLIKNKTYVFKLKETSGRLSGAYKVSISSLDKTETIDVDLMFADGEAMLEYSFNNSKEYEFNLDSYFNIGRDKFIYINFNNKNNLSFIINEK